jgi:calcineurin-like phosphoesterase family protein
MSRTIFIVSDTHFDHANILTFKHTDGTMLRDFSSVGEMNERMVNRWNAVVRDQDIVYHLGDVFLDKGAGTGYDILSRLKGRKRLILGNHDTVNERLLKSFEKIMVWRMFPEHNCLLTHVPVHQSSLWKVQYNLHGHIHRNPSPTEQHINCCVEVQDYTPKAIEELVPR